MIERGPEILQCLVVISGIMGFAGCTLGQPQRQYGPIPQGIASQSAAGGNTISGSASLISSSGYVRTCEGNAVYLMPVTPATTDLMIRLFNQPSGGIGQRYKFEHQRSDILNSGMRVECQRGGTFKFEHVADGSYYAVTDVTWLLRWAREGAALGQSVQALGGKTTELDLRHAY